MTQIFVFGNSIVQGCYDDKFGGWVERLKVFYMKYDENTIIYNLGVRGDTTNELIERFEFEIKQRRDIEEEIIIVISIGINDSYLSNIKKFEENINKLIKLSKKYTNNIIFLGLNSVIEEITNPVPWNKEAFYKNENIRKFNDALKKSSKENKVFFINIFGLLNKNDFYSDDGVHPNPKGHEKIFEVVRDFLVKK